VGVGGSRGGGVGGGVRAGGEDDGGESLGEGGEGRGVGDPVAGRNSTPARSNSSSSASSRSVRQVGELAADGGGGAWVFVEHGAGDAVLVENHAVARPVKPAPTTATRVLSGGVLWGWQAQGAAARSTSVAVGDEVGDGDRLVAGAAAAAGLARAVAHAAQDAGEREFAADRGGGVAGLVLAQVLEHGGDGEVGRADPLAGERQSPRWSLNSSSSAIRRASRTSGESDSTSIPSTTREPQRG
jgi:hypothetical protein